MKFLWLILLLGYISCQNKPREKNVHQLTLANYKGTTNVESPTTLRKPKPIDLSTADTSYWFRYEGRINGYEVSVYSIRERRAAAQTEEATQKSSAVAALLIFKHRDGTKFQVIAQSFNDRHISQQNWENNWEEKDSYTYVPYDFNRIFTLSEESSEATARGIEESPFFFGDVDFDGKDELIVCRYKDGKYNRYNCFECYDIRVTQQGRSATQITYPPFDYLRVDLPTLIRRNERFIPGAGMGLMTPIRLSNNAPKTHLL